MAKVRSVSKGSKGPVQVEASKPDRVTVKLSVSVETKRRLDLEAFGLAVSIGEVVDSMVAASPQRFVLQDRGKGDSKAQGAAGSRVTPGPSAQGLSVLRGATPTLDPLGEVG